MRQRHILQHGTRNIHNEIRVHVMFQYGTFVHDMPTHHVAVAACYGTFVLRLARVTCSYWNIHA